MSALRKNNVKLALLIMGALLFGSVLPTSAEILLETGGEGSAFRLSNFHVPMSGIIIFSPMPSASSSPSVANNLQRSHAWSAYKGQDIASAGSLVFGGAGVATDRQMAVRANVSRAQAFRQDYYK